MNWDDTRVFLALCREHTLRGAARALHIDQATVGRRLASLEAALGSTLFLRTSSGYLLTPAGEAAFELAEKMERSALELLRRTRGMDHRLSGEVRLSTTDSLAVDFVLPALARLHLEHPDIRVLLDSASAVVDLPKRETDIAIRTLRPENPDLILRKLASWPMGLFASADYLRRNGVPVPGERFRGHDLVMYEPYWHSQRELTLGGEPIRDGRVVIAVNSNMMVRQALARGLGSASCRCTWASATDWCGSGRSVSDAGHTRCGWLPTGPAPHRAGPRGDRAAGGGVRRSAGLSLQRRRRVPVECGGATRNRAS